MALEPDVFISFLAPGRIGKGIAIGLITILAFEIKKRRSEAHEQFVLTNHQVDALIIQRLLSRLGYSAGSNDFNRVLMWR